MIYIANIENNIVQGVQVSSLDSIPDGWIVVGPENIFGIGWIYDGLSFCEPITDPE